MGDRAVPVVEFKKLSKSFVDLRLDTKLMKDSKDIFRQITANHLSYLVRLQNDEINKDYPEEVPQRLLWPGKSLFSNTERASFKQELGPVEAEDFTGNPVKQRQKKRKRYSGTYSMEAVTSTYTVAAEEPNNSKHKRNVSESSTCSTMSKASSSLFIAPLKIRISVPQALRKPSGYSFSDLPGSASSSSSSSDSSDEDTKNERKVPIQTEQEEPKLMKLPCQLPLSNTRAVNPSPKPVVMDVPDAPFVIPEKQSEGAEAVATKPKPVIKKILLKPPVIKPKPFKFEKPKIVEARQMAPKTNKPIPKETLDKQKLRRIPRIPKKVKNPLEDLGGIFTVDNGWEKTEELAKVKEQPRPASPVFIALEAIRSPPLQVLRQEFTEIRVTKKQLSPIRAPTAVNFVKPVKIDVSDTGTNKFNRHRDSDDSSSDDEIPDIRTKAASFSSSSSSESEDGGKSADDTPEAASEPKATHDEDSSSSSDGCDKEGKDDSDKGGSPKQMDTSDFEDGTLFLFDNELDYDSDDDRDVSYEPPKSLASQLAKAAPKVVPKAVPVVPEVNYTAELDELKLTLRKEEWLPITAPQEDAKSEFDRNTDVIMAAIAPRLDTPELRILQQFFGNVCIDFLEDNCPKQPCKHYLPDTQAVADRLDRCALKSIDDAFNLALQFPAKLLFPYFGQFAEQFTKKAFVALGDESRLARMIMECERNARSHSMYRTVAGALEIAAPMPSYQATRFIIKYHTDSPYAREVIIQMIIDTGPDLIRNISYLQDIAATQTIPTPTIDKILSNCVTYHDPALPNLCLKLLMPLQAEQISELTTKTMTKFIALQVELSANNESREMKAAHVATKIAQLPKKRPPPQV